MNKLMSDLIYHIVILLLIVILRNSIFNGYERVNISFGYTYHRNLIFMLDQYFTQYEHCNSIFHYSK